MKTAPVQHVHVKRDDGSIVLFPVSKHVLSFKEAQAHAHTIPEAAAQKLPFFSWRRRVNVAALALLFAVSTVSTASLHAGNTLSYFRDIETSLANFFGAALLDFVVADASISRTITATTTPLVIPVMTPESGSLETLYKVTAAYTAGNLALCNALDVVATTSPFIYSGDLLTMSTVATTTDGAWQMGLLLTATSGIAHGDICELDLIYRGWHPSAAEYTGFTDEEKVHLIITYEAPANVLDIVLNEFLPNPHPSAGGLNFGTENSDKPLGEWIELYNKGPVPQDIAGWFMTDASGGVGNTHAVISATNTLPAGTIIPPNGWLVVFMGKPSLNNTGDEIYLYTPDGVQVDFVTYDDPSSFCENDPSLGVGNPNTGFTGTPANGQGGDCSPNQIAPNKSYARFPDGTGPWYDPVPTPGYWNVVLPGDLLLEAPSEDALSEESTTAFEPVPAEPVPEEIPAAESSPTSPTETNEEPTVEAPVENHSPSEAAPLNPPVENSSPSEAPTETPPAEVPTQENSSPSDTPTEETPTVATETPLTAETIPPVEQPAEGSTPESAPAQELTPDSTSSTSSTNSPQAEPAPDSTSSPQAEPTPPAEVPPPPPAETPAA